MANNDKFRASFGKRIDKAQGKFDSVMSRVIVAIDKKLVEVSPVDLGTFKSNWVPGDGAINTTTTESTTPANNEAAIMAIKIRGQTIYLTNSLDYAKALDEGHSKLQAPAPLGVVSLALMQSDAIIRAAAAQVKKL